MKKQHIVLSVFGIFAVASILPGDALAEDAPRQPLQELRMEWHEDRVENRDVRQADRREFFADWTTHKQEARERFMGERGQFKGRLASSTDSVRARFQGQKKEAVNGHLEAMHTRFDTVITKLTTLADRIEARIEIAEADGADVVEARRALEDAKTAIATAETVNTETQAAIADALENEEEISREGLRTLISESKEAIKVAHEALVAVVQKLKTSSN